MIPDPRFSEEEPDVFREGRESIPTKNQGGSGSSNGAPLRRWEDPTPLCKSAAIQPSSCFQDGDTHPGWAHCLLSPESFPMVPAGPDADVTWEETQAGASGNRSKRLFGCNCGPPSFLRDQQGMGTEGGHCGARSGNSALTSVSQWRAGPAGVPRAWPTGLSQG